VKANRLCGNWNNAGDRVQEFVLADFARKMERERDKYQEQADALVERLGSTQERMIDAERERDEARKWSATLADAGDEIRAQLREEQQLHIQTLNERDEARVLAYILNEALCLIANGTSCRECGGDDQARLACEAIAAWREAHSEI
jgi:hypothetical protein